MKPDCRNDCALPDPFPRRIHNRPGLSRIRYCIGTWSDFRETILRQMNKEAALAGWTYRVSDDPGIALLEGAAVLGDILTFYQEVYANEVYLRTAEWRESISDLVRLLGYRLAPGIGGRGTFAFLIKKKIAIVPKGFPIKAQVKGLDGTCEFETTYELTAYPALSEFRLYRPRKSMAAVSSGLRKLELHAVDGSSNPDRLAEAEIGKGDRLMLVPDPVSYVSSSHSLPAQKKSEILIVSKVERVLDRTVIHFEGELTETRGATVTAYKLGRSFRHYGYAAPAQIPVYNSSSDTLTYDTTSYSRMLFTPSGPYYVPQHNSIFKGKEMALAQEVDDLAAGSEIICQGEVSFSSYTTRYPFTYVRTIKDVRSDSFMWANVTGASTVIELDALLVPGTSGASPYADVRSLRFHETLGPSLTLHAPADWNSGSISGKQLNFYGTYDAAVSLAGRKVMFEDQDGTLEQITISSKKTDFTLTGRDKTHKWIWTVALSGVPNSFDLEDFDEDEPTVTVYGNLIEATQGKSERNKVLGNGDSRQRFQTFKLPKTPLTYHTVSSETPPEVPELKIYVDGRLWKRVPTFFTSAADDEVYIVREDHEGVSWVQFGDGKTGKRLPSGLKNVVAEYRTGNAAYGVLKTDTTVQAGSKLDNLDKILLPGLVSGGDSAETGDNARAAAPGKVQSLDRLVSIKDYESVALAIAGVSKAMAAWDLVDGVPSVVVTVLMDSGRSAEINAVRKTLNEYNRCRGAQRFPIEIIQGQREYIALAADVAFDATYQQTDVELDIKETLGLAGEEKSGVDGSRGLLAEAQRSFGQPEYASRLAAIIQNVEGVLWAKVKALQSLGVSDAPKTLTLPTTTVFNTDLACDSDRILALYSGLLKLSPISTPATEAC
ncbi:MAG: hypothetical protein P8Z34_15195 [Anaerolineales bacterium]|jgi:hypothetical protein